MRYTRAVISLCFAASGSAALGEEVRWPDPTIQIPPLVRSFIAAECSRFAMPHETPAECGLGESYGHRAVVMLLNDPDLGEWAASRYRACAKSPDRTNGRFHRNLADCISAPLGLRWRFEFSERTRAKPGLPAAGIVSRRADLAAFPQAGMPLETSGS